MLQHWFDVALRCVTCCNVNQQLVTRAHNKVMLDITCRSFRNIEECKVTWKVMFPPSAIRLQLHLYIWTSYNICTLYCYNAQDMCNIGQHLIRHVQRKIICWNIVNHDYIFVRMSLSITQHVTTSVNMKINVNIMCSMLQHRYTQLHHTTTCPHSIPTIRNTCTSLSHIV